MNKTANNNPLKYQQAKRRSGQRYRPSGVTLCLALLVLTLAIASPFFSTSSSASSKNEGAPSSQFNSLFQPTAGTVTIKSGNYIGITTSDTTETAKFTKQIFSSSDCTSGGGSIDMVTGVNSTTGHSF